MNAPSSLGRYLWPKSLAGKAGIVALFFGFVLVGAYLAADYFTSKRLAEAWKQCEEWGLTNDLEALLGPTLPPEKNASTALRLAAPSAFLCEVAAQRKHNVTPLDDPMENRAYIAEFDALLSDAEYERSLAEADQREGYRSTVDLPRPLSFNISTFNAFGSERRLIARTEGAVAMNLAVKGRRDEAARRLVRLLRITRKWQDKEPFQNFTLVNIGVRGYAVDVLNLILRRGGPLTKEVHLEIDAELARQESLRSVLVPLLRTDALFMVDAFEGLPLKSVPFGNLLGTAGRTHLLQTALRLKSTFNLPFPEANKATAALGGEIIELRNAWLGAYFTLGSDGLWTSFTMTRRSVERSIAKVRCLRIVNAMAAKGDFNAELSSLGLPQDVLIDPFDEKPLRIKRTDKGPIIYSVGDNATDDGGKLEYPSPTDVGLGPNTYRPVS